VPESNPTVPYVNPWLVAVAVMFGTFMEVLDTTVVNVSLPHIAGNLSATTEEATWALTSYLVANAIVLPITGWLANFFGRKRLLMISVTGFTAASFLCGFSPTLSALIFFRVLQGLFGGALQPISQAVLLEAFPAHMRGRAMAFWGQGIVVAPILGPVLGGWLTDSYSWRWVFYINIPVGIACILMTRAFVFDPAYIKRGNAKVDGWGIGMLAVGIAALQLVLDRGQQEDWFESSSIVWLSFAAAVMLAGFVVWELYVPAPVVNLRVFRDRTFSTGVVLMTVLGFVLYGSLVLLPIWLQTLLGYPSLQAGFAMAPRGVGSLLGMQLVGSLLQRFDARKFLAAGLAIASLTLYQLSNLNLQAGYWDFFWPQFVQGLSLAMLFVPLTTITMGSIRREDMGNAASLFNLLRNLGGGIGIAATTTMVSRNSQWFMQTLGSHVTAYNPQARQLFAATQKGMIAHGVDPTTAAHRSLGAVFGLVYRQAALLSFVNVFRVLAVIFICMVPLILLTKRPPTGAPSEAAH
jgi:MFS transporter, DHA2 family, multidrug resistance protein